MSTPSDFNKAIIEEFRANAGKVGGPFEGKTLLLLHTTGAKSGLERIHPVAYVRDGDHFIVVASKGGAPANPSWYHNLVAHPHVTVEVGSGRFPLVASVASEPDRSRLYDKMIAMMPVFADYRLRTTRVIPVIILRREDGAAS
ncbi:MAG TPA: nitroreductase family deazaflavin-dependent oxidoreductase [Anaerolineales bacterium]|nr:nitroreductase family deazaflavin-dependent oxidoreductase [Anaerolineales bacterium]